MRRVLFIASLLTVGFVAPASAEDDTDERYEVVLGDAMRDYVEGRYEQALDKFYRAFALKQSAFTLKFIARSHDFTGNCSARASAVDLLSDMFPRTPAPPAQVCAEVGELELYCGAPGTVVVNGTFNAACGTTILLPIGRHVVVHRELRRQKHVELAPGSRVSVAFYPRPRKWTTFSGDPLPTSLVDDPDMPRKFEVRKWIAK